MDELLVNNTPQSTATLQRQQNEDSTAEAFINKLHSEGEKGVSVTKWVLFNTKNKL